MVILLCCFYSVTHLYPTLFDPMNWSMPGFPVLHYLPAFAQTHVHWVSEAIQISHPLLTPFSSCLQSFQVSGSFPVTWLFASGNQSSGASASASVLPMNFLLFFSLSVMSNSLWPHGLQHTRLPWPSPTPGVYSNSCLLSQWCHPTISSSVVPFSFCLQS